MTALVIASLAAWTMDSMTRAVLRIPIEFDPPLKILCIQANDTAACTSLIRNFQVHETRIAAIDFGASDEIAAACSDRTFKVWKRQVRMKIEN